MLLNISILDGFFQFVGFTIGLIILLYILYIISHNASKYKESRIPIEDISLLLEAFKKYQKEALRDELYEEMYNINGIIYCLERGEIPEQVYQFQWVKVSTSPILMSDKNNDKTSLEVDKQIFYVVNGLKNKTL